MKEEVKEKLKELTRNSKRVKIIGYYESLNGLADGIGESGKTFVDSYNKSCEEYKIKNQEWVNKLKDLGIVAIHPDDGWHHREEHTFSLSYPYIDLGVKVGDMVALGSYDKFVVVIVTKISGILSKTYHYKSTIH